MRERGTLGLVFQGIVALGLSTIPFWAQSFLDGSSKYQYLFEPPYLYQYIAVALALVFSPQIVAFALLCWRTLSSLLFYVVYRTTRGAWPVTVVTVVALAALTAGTVNLAAGGVRYGYSALREIRDHEQSYRGLLLDRINQIELNGGPTESFEAIDSLLALYPDADAGRMAEWRKKVNLAQAVSGRLQAKADGFRSKDQTQSSIYFYKAALDVWPWNAAALVGLRGYRAMFDSSAESLTTLYDACTTADGDPLSTSEAAWPFVSRAPNSLRELARSSDPLAQAQARVELCAEATKTKTASAYVTELTGRLFDDRSAADGGS